MKAQRRSRYDDDDEGGGGDGGKKARVSESAGVEAASQSAQSSAEARMGGAEDGRASARAPGGVGGGAEDGRASARAPGGVGGGAEDGRASARAPGGVGVGAAGGPSLAAASFFSGCRSVAAYRPIHAIDEGTYGKVFLAEDRLTRERVAIKQIKFEAVSANEGFPLTALREVGTLLELSGQPHVVRAREMVTGASLDKVYLVMDFAPQSVRDWLARAPAAARLTAAEVKCLARQLLAGLAAVHARWIAHRDLKPANLLLGAGGRLMLCDFGLARKFGAPARADMTALVVTLWYRAPELLLGARAYGPAVDVWAAGAIVAEFLTRAPLFPAANEADALALIFRLRGTPTDADWPGWRALPAARALGAGERQYAPRALRDALGVGGAGALLGAQISDLGLDLVAGLLTLDPARRLTAQEALDHAWFREAPPPCDPLLLPDFPAK
jgi:cell division cycle 2-like protein